MARRTGGRTSRVQAMARWLLLTFALQAVGALAQDPGIHSFKSNGSGCPGNAVGQISTDGKVLSITFTNFVATTDGPMSNRRRNCLVSLRLKYSPEWAVSMDTMILRGYTKLDDRVKGHRKVMISVQGENETRSFRAEITGPIDDDYEESGTIAPAVTMACGVRRNLNFNLEAKVDNSANPEGTGVVEMDAQEFVLSFPLKWSQCK